MKAAKPEWRSGLVLVCSECSKRCARGDESQELRRWLKDELKEEGLWGRIRVVKSGCLDLCPKARVAVAIAGGPGGHSLQSFIVDPDHDRHELLDQIRAALEPSAGTSGKGRAGLEF